MRMIVLALLLTCLAASQGCDRVWNAGRDIVTGGPKKERPADTSCDVFLIAVADGSMPDQAKGTCGATDLDQLAKSIAEKLVTGVPSSGKSVAVLTLRNRSKTERCAV